MKSECFEYLRKSEDNRDFRGMSNGSSNIKNEFSNSSNGFMATLNNCPQVHSLAASIAYENTTSHKVFTYDES